MLAPFQAHPWLGVGLALFLSFGLVPRAALAQVPAVSAQPSPGPAADAPQQHFERALTLYRAGQYAQARAELKAAARLDPGGKDLFFNLALVEEKLGKLGDAIAALERFRELETDPAEREHARLTIERLQGAQRAGLVAAQPVPCPPSSPPARKEGPSPILLGAASVSVVSLLVGAVFGLKALADDVDDVSTSRSLSVAQLRDRARRAEREALVADVAFAVALASAGTFAGVWLLSPGETKTRAGGVTLRSEF